MTVRGLFLDYDGTISPLGVSRAESRVPVPTQAVLGRIAERIPVVIVTSKSAEFVVPRTPFATAWSTTNGLELRVGDRVFDKLISKAKLNSLSMGLRRARSQLASSDIYIEEKRNYLGQTIAFCVDWRNSADQVNAKYEAKLLSKHLEALSLYVPFSRGSPFFDVYPMLTSKGNAVQDVCNVLGLKGGIAFMGDSEMDSPAFSLSDLSMGVVNESFQSALNCDYYVRFEDMPIFLSELLDNDLAFNSDFLSVAPFVERKF